MRMPSGQYDQSRLFCGSQKTRRDHAPQRCFCNQVDANRRRCLEVCPCIVQQLSQFDEADGGELTVIHPCSLPRRPRFEVVEDNRYCAVGNAATPVMCRRGALELTSLPFTTSINLCCNATACCAAASPMQQATSARWHLTTPSCSLGHFNLVEHVFGNAHNPQGPMRLMVEHVGDMPGLQWRAVSGHPAQRADAATVLSSQFGRRLARGPCGSGLQEFRLCPLRSSMFDFFVEFS
jgi:hypothetical protein